MPHKDLKNKPLVEAILEIKWRLPSQSEPASQVDHHYRLLLGRFSERIQSDYSFHEPLPTSQIPDGMVAHMAQHRFRVGKEAWPLIQIGPGLMTVNETAGYTWSDFRRRCEAAVTHLFNAHPSKSEFQVQDLTLRYIDAVEVDFENEGIFSFLSDKMKTRISLPESLSAGGRVSQNPSAFFWQTSFRHNEPGGLMTLRFAMGQHMGKPSLIWEILVQTIQDKIPRMPDDFPRWLEKAHELTDDWFFKLIEGELERRFSGE